MTWRLYQRAFELTAVIMMMAGVILMWMQKDPRHFLIYGGFALLATGKLTQALNIYDPSFKILKIASCLSIYLLVLLNVFYNIQSIIYIVIPLGVYYLLHYRLMFQEKKS